MTDVPKARRGYALMAERRMPPRLTHVIPQLDWGDESYHLSEWVVALDACGLNSRIITLQPDVCVPVSLERSRTQIDLLPIRGRYDLPGYWKLAEQLQRCATIHSWGGATSVVGWLQRLGMCRAHDFTTSQSQTILRASPSEPLRVEFGLWNQPTMSTDISVCYRLPQLNDPSNRSWDHTGDFRQQLGLPASCKLIGTAGPLTPSCGITDVIWAADLLKVVRDDTHVVIIGDGPHRWRWEHFRDSVQIRDRVHFWSASAEVCGRIGQLDCYWDVRRGRRLGWGALCAIGTGVPIVATRGGERDLLLDDGTDETTLIERGDRAQLARLSIRILDDSGFATKAAEVATKNFHAAHEFVDGRDQEKGASYYHEKVGSMLQAKPATISA